MQGPHGIFQECDVAGWICDGTIIRSEEISWEADTSTIDQLSSHAQQVFFVGGTDAQQCQRKHHICPVIRQR